jgi:hemolysin activation/secretion protein
MKTKLITLAIFALGQGAINAQSLGAGSQMQQIPPVPAPPQAFPEVRIDRGSAPAATLPQGTAIQVNSLRLTGQTQYSEATLLAVTGFTPGSQLNLTELRGMAAKISAFYNQNGFFVAQAYLPAQDIKAGAVTIAVIEGRYGKVTLNNQSKLSTGLANGPMGGLNSGDLVATAPLEERLLLLSDIRGVNVKSTLSPGAAVGTSDLLVDVTPGKTIDGEIDADNAGNYYTGENRLGATVNLNNLAGLGDVASLRVMTSGPGLNYARGSYQVQLGRATAGVAYSALRYELGHGYESLQANGTSKIASIYGIYPLIRSRNDNLYARLDYDHKTMQDRVDANSPPTVTDKKAKVLTATLYGDRRDSLGGGGVTNYSLAWSAGDVQSTPAPSTTPSTDGSFNKLGFNLSRLQQLSGPLSLYAGVKGQLVSRHLDSSEQMELGGMYGVRAYPEGEAFGDQGYVLNLEARMLLPKFSPDMPGQMQLIGFVDTGTISTNKDAWGAGQNARTLSAAGVGLTWAENNNFLVRAYYARKLGDEVATSAPDKSGRFWLQLVKYF